MDEKPTAYSADELRDQLLDAIRARTRLWATLPDVDAATGESRTILDRCEGVVFSVLAVLDGCADLPAFDLVARPHPDDKAFHQAEGERWVEDGTTISDMLHERLHR